MQGDLEAAHVEASASLSVAADAGWADDIQSTSAHLALALVHFQRSELAACEHALGQAALVLDRKPDLLLGVARGLAEVRLLALNGQDAAAAEALAAARELVASLPGIDFLAGWLTVVEAETALAAGRYEEVLELVDDAAGLDQVSGQGLVLSGRALLALGRTREAMDLVAPVARAGDSALVAVGAWLVIAEGEQELRRDAAAMAALDKALERSAPQLLRRPFRESVTALRPLLERYLAGFGPHSALVESILGLEDRGSAVLLESLTDRELAVLQLLPTMMSNSEIAGELFVSVNTVKAHLKSLYRKLGVASRREAVIQGRRLAASPQLAVTEPTGSR
jgi:LuxR family maltose regulon positive regulatory protein